MPVWCSLMKKDFSWAKSKRLKVEKKGMGTYDVQTESEEQ